MRSFVHLFVRSFVRLSATEAAWQLLGRARPDSSSPLSYSPLFYAIEDLTPSAFIGFL